ncbi:hypothetical protein ACFCW2_11645 [Qipengyuania sp. DSG2-2]|uniref:hypothetical protein n=1 Tax=Qipengyuania sp. DGS2-2 TaxID=3349631 RepID=UPI0036D3B24C
MRISSFALIAPVGMLAACGSDAPPPAPDPIEEPGAEIVECAIGVGSEYAAQCPVERTEVDGEAVLVVHHPGGGFRRFTLASDGSGLTAFDGADQAARSLAGDTLELTVGSDRYRFPARRMNEAPETGETAEGEAEPSGADPAGADPADNAGS